MSIRAEDDSDHNSARMVYRQRLANGMKEGGKSQKKFDLETLRKNNEMKLAYSERGT